MAKGYLEKNIEYFTPPYLYRKDGSGALAARPVIDSAPTAAGYSQQMTVISGQAGSIGKIGLVRLGAATHGADQGQRYIPLSYTTAGPVLRVKSPSTANIAPPGYYMLFITDKAGVPSVAKITKLDPNVVPAPGGPIVGLANRCIDVRGGAPVNSVDLLMYTCHGKANQNWLYTSADKSLRSLGKCMDIPRNVRKSGTRVQLYSCNGSTAQKWERRSDGTIRSASSPTLCLTVKDSSTALSARLQIYTCKGTAAQKWRW